MITLTFLGAAGTVTGSRFVLRVGEARVLVDCGLFQGQKELRQRNWEPFGVEPASLSTVLLTHAHIDHSGWLPRLVHTGFTGDILCTPPTRDLLDIMLRDSARLQEEDADYLNRKGLTKHRPALPLYTQEDVERTLRQVRTIGYGVWREVAPQLSFRFRDAGHLLGSAMVDVTVQDGARRSTLLFSGDVGRVGTPLHTDPEPPGDPDIIVVESTYGDRTHPPGTALAAMTPVLQRMLERRAILLVPAFAVGRSQQMIYCARRLVLDGVLPAFPIYVDSPMAVDATEIYCKYPELHDLEARELGDDCVLDGPEVHFARTVEESKRLNRIEGPAMILSSSGMLSGGRVLHHLRRLLPDPRHMVALVGFQAAGTRGRALQEGAPTISIHKEEIPVRAEIVDLGNLSGHADREELQHWFASVTKTPRAVYITHGEPHAAAALAAQLHAQRGWAAHVPRLGETVDLVAEPGGTA